MTLQELQKEYEKDINLKVELLEDLSLSIPKKLSKYQNYFYSLLENLAEANDKLTVIYNEAYLEYKQGLGKHCNFKFSATEITKVLKADDIYRIQALKVVRLENELKLVEEMMSNVKSIGYSIHNRILLKKIEAGLV